MESNWLVGATDFDTRLIRQPLFAIPEPAKEILTDPSSPRSIRLTLVSCIKFAYICAREPGMPASRAEVQMYGFLANCRPESPTVAKLSSTNIERSFSNELRPSLKRASNSRWVGRDEPQLSTNAQAINAPREAAKMRIVRFEELRFIFPA